MRLRLEVQRAAHWGGVHLPSSWHQCCPSVVPAELAALPAHTAALLSRVLPRSVSPGTLHAGGTLNTAQQHWRQGQYGEQLEKGAAVAVERGKEISSKSWNFMKGVYATVATQVEHVARDNGYKVDLGEHWHRLRSFVVRCKHCRPLRWPG